MTTEQELVVRFATRLDVERLIYTFVPDSDPLVAGLLPSDQRALAYTVPAYAALLPLPNVVRAMTARATADWPDGVVLDCGETHRDGDVAFIRCVIVVPVYAVVAARLDGRLRDATAAPIDARMVLA